MSGGRLVTKDFLDVESAGLDNQDQVAKNSRNHQTNRLGKDVIFSGSEDNGKLLKLDKYMATKLQQIWNKGGLANEESIIRSLRLFKKYMLSKNKCQESITESISDVELSYLLCSSLPRKPGFGMRRPSLLEQSLLPQLCSLGRSDEKSLLANESSTAQMTIFYGGTIHVYDNVSIDQFRAIMQLTGQTSTMDQPETVESSLKQDPVLKSSQTSIPNSTVSASSDSKLHADTRIARRHSIQHFLEKRRSRLARQAPYPTSKESHENRHMESSNSGQEAVHLHFSPAPFPSKVGFNFCKGC